MQNNIYYAPKERKKTKKAFTIIMVGLYLLSRIQISVKSTTQIFIMPQGPKFNDVLVERVQEMHTQNMKHFTKHMKYDKSIRYIFAIYIYHHI